MCPVRSTICPICREPLAPAEISLCYLQTPGEYPTHYACRIAMQEATEEMDLADQEREYRAAEESQAEG